MAAKQFILRCKTKHGQHTLDMLGGESTVTDLKACIFSITGVDPVYLKVLAGFPPKPLDLTNDNCKLDSLPLHSGETLIIEDNRISNDLRAPDSNRKFNMGDSPNTLSPPGILIRHVVPANNSCLFTSIHFAVSGDYDVSCGSSLRQIIADTVAADAQMYNEAFLGKPNKQYCTWILNEDHWGGAIEISILSKYYGIEIVAVDTQNVQPIHFGEDFSYDYRIFLIYDGIHYDPLMLESLDGSQQIQTIFPSTNETILQMALDVAMEAKSSRQFTDIKNFSLRCLVCNVGLIGQKEAREHAMDTKHFNFGEI